MGLNTVAKYAEGTLCIDSAAPAEDADHLVTQDFRCYVHAPNMGASDSTIYICTLQAAITVTGFYMISSLALAADAGNPTVRVSSGDQAAGALTIVTAEIDTADALAIQTKVSAAITTAAVAKGQSLYLRVTDDPGTPLAITELAMLCFVVEYTLTN